jgi:hypothetical protein
MTNLPNRHAGTLQLAVRVPYGRTLVCSQHPPWGFQASTSSLGVEFVAFARSSRSGAREQF